MHAEIYSHQILHEIYSLGFDTTLEDLIQSFVN
jgi:hypothetical protein